MEDMRAVFVHQHAGAIVAIVRVSADMRPAIDQKHLFVTFPGDAFSQHAPSKARSNNQPIKQGFHSDPTFDNESGTEDERSCLLSAISTIVLMGWYLPVSRTGFEHTGVQVRSRRNQLVEQRSKEAALPLAIGHLQQSGFANAAVFPSGIICHRIQTDTLKVGACELCGEHLPGDVV